MLIVLSFHEIQQQQQNFFSPSSVPGFWAGYQPGYPNAYIPPFSLQGFGRLVFFLLPSHHHPVHLSQLKLALIILQRRIILYSTPEGSKAIFVSVVFAFALFLLFC